MTSKINSMEELKSDYKNIEIPIDLDDAIFSGLRRARSKKQRQTLKTYSLNLCASLLIALALLTSAVNISPAFADAALEIPFLGKFVERLIFVDGSASGGKITDGTDISDINTIKEGDTEEIIINFSQLDELQSISAAYTITYFENPSQMQFDVYGARMISAKEDFEAIKELESVKDVYTLMTLDDSLIRFNVVFNYPVDFEVEEFIEPAAIKLRLNKKPDIVSEEMYSVRSTSYDFSESFGHIEETFMHIDMEEALKYRILKDESGGFLYEFKLFESEEAAKEFISELNKHIDIELVVEKRGANMLPSYIE